MQVSIRLGLLNLLGGLRDDDGLGILYITHDIASARYLADEVIVMYAGQVVETGPVEVVTDHPSHPYTQLLLSAAPDPERAGAARCCAAGARRPAWSRRRRVPLPPALPARDGGLRRADPAHDPGGGRARRRLLAARPSPDPGKET